MKYSLEENALKWVRKADFEETIAPKIRMFELTEFRASCWKQKCIIQPVTEASSSKSSSSWLGDGGNTYFLIPSNSKYGQISRIYS